MGKFTGNHRKPLYLIVKTMVSCRFFLKPIHPVPASPTKHQCDFSILSRAGLIRWVSAVPLFVIHKQRRQVGVNCWKKVGKIYQRMLHKWWKHGTMMGKWWIHVAEGWDKLAKMRILCFFELGDDLFSELVKITRGYLGIMDDDSRFWT